MCEMSSARGAVTIGIGRARPRVTVAVDRDRGASVGEARRFVGNSGDGSPLLPSSATIATRSGSYT